MSREEALLETHERGLASTWRSARQHLAGPARMAVLAADPQTLQSAVNRLDKEAWVLLPLVVTEPSEAIQDQLLGVHAALWVTPLCRQMSASEAALLQELSTVAPSHRGWLALDKPQAPSQGDEALRAADSAPADWPLVPGLPLLSDLEPLRREAVLDQLCREAALVLDRRIAQLDQSLGAQNAAAITTRQATPAEQKEAEQWLAKARPVAASLLDDIASWFDEFEAGLEAQLAGLPGHVDGARVIPAWLDHVVGQALDHILDDYHRMLAEAAGPPPAGLHISTRAPSIPIAMDSPSRSGRRRAALAAAVGGAGLLAVGGLWLTSLAALGGSLAVAGARPTRHHDAQAWLEPTRRALRAVRAQCEAACSNGLLPEATRRAEAGDSEIIFALASERENLSRRRERLARPSPREP